MTAPAWKAQALIYEGAARMQAELEGGGTLTLNNLRWLRQEAGEPPTSLRSALSMCRQLIAQHHMAYLTARLTR